MVLIRYATGKFVTSSWIDQYLSPVDPYIFRSLKLKSNPSAIKTRSPRELICGNFCKMVVIVKIIA